MSHFSALVISDKDLMEGDTLDKLLQPYHEFECTGCDDEYVQDVDITADTRDTFAKSTVRRYRDPEGALHNPYGDRFFRDLTAEEQKLVEDRGAFRSSGLSITEKDWGDGKGCRAKAHFLPDGWEEVKVPTSELEDFITWVKDYYDYKTTTTPDTAGDHKYGYVLVNDAGELVKVVRRTNPKDKWDWWQLGGRYAHRLTMKPNAAPQIGQRSWTNRGETFPENTGDVGRAEEIDFDAMRARNRSHRVEAWRETLNASRTLDLEQDETKLDAIRIQFGERYLAAKAEWKASCDRGVIPNRETFWGEQLGDLEPYMRVFIDWGDSRVALTGTLEEFFDGAPTLTCFAMLKNGQWMEQGEMGWWGAHTEEMTPEQWQKVVDEAVAEAANSNSYLAIVDCHI